MPAHAKIHIRGAPWRRAAVVLGLPGAGRPTCKRSPSERNCCRVCRAQSAAACEFSRPRTSNFFSSLASAPAPNSTLEQRQAGPAENPYPRAWRPRRFPSLRRRIMRLRSFKQQALMSENGRERFGSASSDSKLPVFQLNSRRKASSPMRPSVMASNHLAILDPDPADQQAIDDLEDSRVQ